MLKNKKKMIIIIVSIAVLLIAIITIIAIIINKSKNKTENNSGEEITIDTEKLEIEFNEHFLNEETEYVKIRTQLEKSELGKYDVTVYIPEIISERETAKQINTEMYMLIAKVINEAVNVDKYSKYEVEYTSFTNNDILSIIIRFTIKEEDNPRRIIIKTYNYNLETDEKVELSDIIDTNQGNEIEISIMKKIEEENKLSEKTIEQGYSAFIRDTTSDIYKIENANEFFIGKDGILYIVYAYGNQEYTDVVDLILYAL